jgi:2-C-methyl-D-erythritol 4-phosphate cytidylyltransferase/2-C-methyl-D-erythritol 2,4-cyclodiphosphate synthase
MNKCLILVAGGKGVRAGAPQPKQYAMLGGKAILAHAIDYGAHCPQIDLILPVIGANHQAFFADTLEQIGPIAKTKLLPAVTGGSSRQASTARGLEALPESVTHVLVHDAARPFLSGRVVSDLLDAVEDGVGAVPVLTIPDSVKRVEAQQVIEDPDRTGLVRAQTPQAFLKGDILSVFQQLTSDGFTDEASAARQAGLAVHSVEGDERLFKITHPRDFDMAEKALLSRRQDVRVGQGFDVHAFEAGERVTLCGVEIAHSRKLKGHSDADVGLHALTDALLGAIGAGDIGDHFPPSDPQWAGAASHRFLEFAAGMVRQKDGMIAHVDVTLICERPKIGPHRGAMVTAIASWLKIEEARVSVKATTTEKLGFTGRQEGIAAQAIATVRLP